MGGYRTYREEALSAYRAVQIGDPRVVRYRHRSRR